MSDLNTGGLGAAGTDVEELEELAAPMKKWAKRLLKGLAVVTAVGAAVVFTSDGHVQDPGENPCIPDAVVVCP
jgi:hypothetical protein